MKKSMDKYFNKTILLIKKTEEICGHHHSELATRYTENAVIRIEWFRGSLYPCLALEIPPPQDNPQKGPEFAKQIMDFFIAKRGPIFPMGKQ